MIKEKPLNGVYIAQDLPEFDWNELFSSKYQDQFNQFIDQNFGFRPFLIRLFNQVDYSVFNKSHGSGIVIGKKNYLFELWYIDAFTGSDFSGRDSIAEKVRKLEIINKYLNHYNTKFLIVIAPGKGHYYPELIPELYLKFQQKTNYDYYDEFFNNTTLQVLDFNNWFVQMKDTVKYPLFSQTGTHWSEYGAALAADSIIRKIEVLLNKNLKNVKWDQVKLSETPNAADNDLENLMNLFYPIHEYTLAYPVFKEDTDFDLSSPKTITIADSFFWQLIEGRFLISFDYLEFWYYYNSVYPESTEEKITVREIDVLDRMINTDVVLLEFSTSNLRDFGSGFIEDVYRIFTDTEYLKSRKTINIIRRIKASPEWMKDIMEKAQNNNIPLDSMIFLDAQYIAEMEIADLHLPGIDQLQ
ncbi:MAG: hypothetical protein JW731_13425 [Bacteroidales bacterium]|nr:hypothetical protein [Bacteroidales bacterium]